MPEAAPQASAATLPTAAPATTPEVPSSPPPSPLPADSGGGGAPPAAAAAPAPAADYQDVLDVIRQQHPDLAGRFSSGDQAVTYLLQEARRAQELQRLAPYAQEYVQNARQFQEWRSQQETARREAEAKKSQWFSAPEFNPDWRNAVERDAQGNLVAKQGYPPDVVNKYLAALNHQRGFLDKFSFDPIGAIRPGIEQVVRELAGQLVQQNLSGYAEQQQANDFVAQNRAWLFEAPGRLSPWGEIFQGAVQEAAQMRLPTIEAQQKYAMRAVQAAYAGHVLAGNQQQPPAAPAAPAAPADPNAAAKAAFLAGAQRRPAAPAAPAAQHQPAQPTPGQPAPSGGNHVNRLQRLLAKNALSEGLTNGLTQMPG